MLRIGLYLAAILAAASPSLALAKADKAVRVTNYRDGETIRYPVPLLCGTIAGDAVDGVTAINKSSKRGTREMKGLVHKGRFKVLTELVPGPNKLLIKAGKHARPFTLTYKPQTNPYKVRVFYFVGKEGDVRFQSPLPNERYDYRGKLDTAMKLMQTFTAEEMHRHGYGRRTFNLELDANGRVIAHLLKSPLPAKEYWKDGGINGGALFGQIAWLINKQFPDPKSRNLTIIGLSRFDAATKKVYASAALGGGAYAIFGGTSLFTWPDSLGEVQRAFSDDTIMDTSKFLSDSIGRNTHWATASTCIGHSLHELGHALGLPHTQGQRCPIMQRGGDQFNRYWTLVEPLHARRKKTCQFKDDEEAQWAPPSAAALARHRSFALDERTYSEKNTISIEVDERTLEFVVRSQAGVAFVGVERPGAARFFIRAAPGTAAPKEVRIAASTVAPVVKTDDLIVRVVDADGYLRHESIAARFRRFVTSWRVAPAPESRPSVTAFPEMTPAKIQAIAKAALAGKTLSTKRPHVDFGNLFGAHRRSKVAVYGARRIWADKAQPVKIHTGSGSNFRLWLNGKAIQKVVRTGWPRADMETVSATLAEGENLLLVEAMPGEKSWTFLLRLTDPSGLALAVGDDGKLTRPTSRMQAVLLGQ